MSKLNRATKSEGARGKAAADRPPKGTVRTASGRLIGAPIPGGRLSQAEVQRAVLAARSSGRK